MRVGPQVADFVLDTTKTNNHEASPDTTPQPQFAVDLIDLAAHSLPISDETLILTLGFFVTITTTASHPQALPFPC